MHCRLEITTVDVDLLASSKGETTTKEGCCHGHGNHGRRYCYYDCRNPQRTMGLVDESMTTTALLTVVVN
jgi:hypothetical protein